MRVDLDRFPAEVQAALSKLNRLQLLELTQGMVHAMERHGVAPITCDDSLCEDSVIVICGRKVFGRIQALNVEERALNAQAEAALAVARARG